MINEISYGIIPVRDGRVLMLRAYLTWDFPKGKPESGETSIDTALREVQEESGLSNPEFKWGMAVFTSKPYKKNRKQATYYIAEFPTGEVVIEPNPEHGRVEHHEFRWMTIDEASALLPDRLAGCDKWIYSVINDG